jgi:hypothetical protein
MRRADSTAALTVVLEDIRSQNKAVIEAVQTLEQTMHREFAAVHAEIGAIHGEIGAIHGELGSVRAGVAHHSRELRDLAVVIDRKADGAALVALEQRVTAIERRTGA